MTHNKLSSVASAAVVAGGLGFALLTAGAGAAAAVTPLPPTISVNPNNVMVNTNTTVTGHNFKPRSTVVLTECSKTNWIAPQNPCDTNNGVTVTTNSLGGFRTLMKVETCLGVAVPAGVSEVCYIGVVHPAGVDTIVLQPHAKIVVTFP
jgi:hypothetical protein